MTDYTTHCGCGRTLHYASPRIEAMMHDFVAKLGVTITVRTPDGAFQVPRHYIALHGFKASELPELAVRYGWEWIR